MTIYSKLLKEPFKLYSNWVKENPQLVGDTETLIKWMSYFIAGRMSNSAIVAEFIFSLSNILALVNDRIIERRINSSSVLNENSNYIKLFLTTLEYFEVLIEISGRQLYGEKGRWVLIFLVQFLKWLGRLLLLRFYSNDIINLPLIPNLNRKLLINDSPNLNDELSKEKPSFTFKLKRSGRTVRKIEGAPPFHLRSWDDLECNEIEMKNNSTMDLAELIYITKPLLHLGAAGIFGYKKWNSFLIALILDILSLRLYYNNRHLLTKKQRISLSKRCTYLLLYMVRSPFYDNYSKDKFNRLLSFISNNIPILGFICNPIAEYIPQWQDTYFYIWST